jgi:hypothetical protein
MENEIIVEREATTEEYQEVEELSAETDGLRTGFRRKPDRIPMIADSL